MRGAAQGNKTSCVQQKNIEVKTKKKKQKKPGNGDGDSSSEILQPFWKKRAWADPTVENEKTFMNRVEDKIKIPEEVKLWLVDKTAVLSFCKEECGFHYKGLCKLQEISWKHR